MTKKEQIAYEKNMKEHYKEQSEIYIDMYHKYVALFDSAVRELTTKNMMVEYLLDTLHEIKALDEDSIETAIAKNAIDRHNLDMIIHNKLVAMWQESFNSNQDEDGDTEE